MLSFEADKNMAANAMETDDVTHLPSNTLRRSSSAPNVSAAVINENVPAFQPIQKSRERRFSTSQVAVNVVSKIPRIDVTNDLYFFGGLDLSVYRACCFLCILMCYFFQGSPASRIAQLIKVNALFLMAF